MSCLRPATPGFIATLTATILLALVTFCVPYLKSIYFLKANISVGGHNGSITFGTLGYCLELSNGTTCSTPSIGYQLDINGLVGNRLPVQIPQVAVKWLTYALVLHIVALGLSAASAIFGLLAHIREMSMTCCSTFISGFAATVALIAFVFDIILFFVAKARIQRVGSAQIGSAIWLTLASWLLLFFSGCFFTIGRCCINRRPRGDDQWKKNGDYEERLRLDAVKAEADRKARQKTEGGLPAFHEVQPLTARIDGDAVYTDETYKDSTISSSHTGHTGRRDGYAPAPEGSRAVDEYYSPSNPTLFYPPGVQQHAAHRQNTSATYNNLLAYPQNAPTGYPPLPVTASPPPVSQYRSPPPQTYLDPYGNASQGYGHGAQDSSCKYGTVHQKNCLTHECIDHSAASHQQQPSNYSQYNDPYTSSYQAQRQPSYTTVPYASPLTSNPGSPPMPTTSYPANASASYFPGPVGAGDQDYAARSSGYQQPGSTYQSPIPPPINTNAAYVASNTSPIKGPRPQPSSSAAVMQHEDAPPGYDAGSSNITGTWGKH
ncbi:hypothetical protein AMATHDRAFT_140506 [Amanita thiersii Skay4041]|uniref:Pali-domain-containing protein n=1 Tax=Amanita thiersii Skay4041 TaxID=703135 RepID=A0A2A9NQ99_9AGAR|nr:hypothetical protein AMATHDRAFT_140506 [Amanita thiersii Skay4041]